ncbi:MAG: penicillin acylase family protein [Taibaiella sp.]|nr:penicillin acylase family protein [Taibaiella sp.]
MAWNTTNGKRKRPNKIWGYILVVFTTALVYILDHPLGALPALGPLLDPVHGCWANAEPASFDYNLNEDLPALTGKAIVNFDDQFVPHINATNDHDLYYIQGYLHAWFRLWQMEMQTRAAAGRISEIAGEKALPFDRKQRRKGMVYAAENSLRAAEANPVTKAMLDAYTAGVNQFIATRGKHQLPLEYKLMGFKPEPWTNLKCILLLKYMADDLSGESDDIAHSYLRTLMSEAEFNLLYPDKIPGSSPVVPAGTPFAPATISVSAPPADSSSFVPISATDFESLPQHGKGSNSWALSGSRTASGDPILCNDPHLGLNLPSLWFQVQLSAPGINVCGASLPGAPGVVIGFNDHISWGLTNNYRDVKDFYEIKPVEGDAGKYWFNGQQVPYTTRMERIAVKGKPDYVDTVQYTIHGVLLYDGRYHEKFSTRKLLAVKWMGYEASNEYMAIYKLNRAGNYDEYVDAIQHFECPAQNMIYADRQGHIAIWGQGKFPAKWRGQGKYVMQGLDSSTLWGPVIPMAENPHALDPAQGYLASANENTTDTAYPYPYTGDFVELRAWRINELLAKTAEVTVPDMQAMQGDDYSILAANVLPMMLDACKVYKGKYLDSLRAWDYQLRPYSMCGTVFQHWWKILYSSIWMDDLPNVPGETLPLAERTMQLMLTDSTLRFYDDPRTAKRETLADIIRRSYYQTSQALAEKEKKGSLDWYKVKNTGVRHLAKLDAFSYTGLETGGWGNTINAMKEDHGPSWRMVVQMGKEIEAYGIYPGGQSGNPGSKYYANYLPMWVKGQYNKLHFYPAGKAENSAAKYVWTLKPASK